MNSLAGIYSFGILPSKIASLIASLIIPISFEGFKLNVLMISSQEIGG